MDWDAAAAVRDDLSREVYCILGMPIDAIELPGVVRRIETAAEKATPLVISTPNVNFLVASLIDPEFRDSLLLSDLCPADGIPIVWIARMLGIPIRHRVAGADIFEALKSRPSPARPLKVFLFGSTEPVAAAAAEELNTCNPAAIQCVGFSCPGFGSVDEMGDPELIHRINASNADFLVTALGAKKGQAWLLQNHRRLRVPIRSHLGATINFQAGTVRRAPEAMRRLGLEWLWRIKEEPSLFRRYWRDGWVLLRLLLTRALPLAAIEYLQRRRARARHSSITACDGSDGATTVRIRGDATAGLVPQAIACFRDVVADGKQVVVDLSKARNVDARFFGLLLMLGKTLKGRGSAPRFVGASHWLRTLFGLNGLGYLLSSSKST
jgi:N-acetylglucosaminyldiphosphoundecaprenol N-acetyl-beta-D-mannosaminyltransferase